MSFNSASVSVLQGKHHPANGQYWRQPAPDSGKNSRELVDSHNDLDSKLLAVLDMPCKIFAALLQRAQIFLEISLMERLAGSNVRPSAMHLQGPRRSNNNSRIGSEPTDTALDVAEFLHAHVSAEPAFGEDKAFAFRGIAGLSPG
jgi:hypothetical protein